MKDRTAGIAPGHALLAPAFYLVGLAVAMDGVAQALVVGGPEAPLWSVRWRFGFSGIVYLYLPICLLGLAIFSIAAAAVRQRRMLMTACIIETTLAIAAFLGLLMFLLDATQIGAGVPETLRGGFNITVAQTAFTGGMATVLLGALAAGSGKMARHLRSTRRTGSTDLRSGLVVGRES